MSMKSSTVSPGAGHSVTKPSDNDPVGHGVGGAIKGFGGGKAPNPGPHDNQDKGGKVTGKVTGFSGGVKSGKV